MQERNGPAEHCKNELLLFVSLRAPFLRNEVACELVYLRAGCDSRTESQGEYILSLVCDNAVGKLSFV